MSVHFITGKPGGGKSLYAVRLIADELRIGCRPVVTNVSLRLGELNEYLQRDGRFPESGVVGRVQLLSDDETKRFWRVRPYLDVDGAWQIARIGDTSETDWKAGKRPCLQVAGCGGVLYVIDELHLFFSAREWASTGAEALFYLSQHRKLGDDVVCVTQAVGHVDKQFRNLAQDFTTLRNLGKEKWKLFRGPRAFLRQTYLSVPTGPQVPCLPVLRKMSGVVYWCGG